MSKETLKINREKWRTGRYGFGDGDSILGESYLLSGKGGRCCLGFLAIYCKFSDIDIYNQCLPSLTPILSNCFWPEELFLKCENYLNDEGQCDTWEEIFAQLNDFEYIDDKTREEWILTGFKIVLDIDVEFTGEYPKINKGQHE